MTQHFWSYRFACDGPGKSDVAECDLVREIFEGRLDPACLVSSPTRSQGKWYPISQVPSLLEVWKRGERERGERDREQAAGSELSLALSQSALTESLTADEGLARCRDLERTATVLQQQGDLGQALLRYREQEQLARQFRLEEQLHRSLGCQAFIHADQGDFERSLGLHQEEEQICRAMNDADGLASSLASQAFVLSRWGKPHEATERLREAEQILRKLDDLDRLSICVRQMAMVRRSSGDLAGALASYEEWQRLSRQRADLSDTLLAIEQQTDVLMEMESYDQATEAFEQLEELAVMTESARHQGLSHYGRGEIWQRQNKLNEALDFYAQAKDLFETESLPAELISTIFRIAEVLYELYQRGEALASEPAEQYEKLEALCIQHGDLRGAALAMMNRATILMSDDADLDAAEQCIQNALKFTTEHALTTELQTVQAIAVEIESRRAGGL